MITTSTDQPKKVVPAPSRTPEKCQHIRIQDCDKQVQRVFSECYHCSLGLITECTGKPTMEEYKGRQQEKRSSSRMPHLLQNRASD